MVTDEIQPTEDLVTPERRAKGDLEVAINGRGKVSRAIPANLTIIKELTRRGSFPHHYEIYGVGFLELQAAFLAPWRARNSVALLEREALEQLGLVISNSKADEMYQHVSRLFGVQKMAVVQWVVESSERRIIRPRNKELKERRQNRIGMFKECFEELVKLMDEERERIFRES